MDNPLSQFFSIEERTDGVFIRVTPEQKSAVSLAAVAKAIENANITNADMDKISEIVNRARNLPERIGPLFEYYNSALDNYITISMNERKAVIRMNSLCLANGIKPTPAAVLHFLKLRGVRSGVQTDAVVKAVLDAKYDADIVVAVATEPVNGTDAKIEFSIDISTTAKPHERADGTVDFRDIQAFVQVAKDQVIATKVPPTPGTPGIAVTGAALHPTSGKDIPFPAGKNIRISSDGKEMIADKAGVLKTEGGMYSITEQLKVASDIDFSVGNIKHTGDLEISGGIKPGFVVEAEGNITIHGVVESSRVISRNGRVTVRQGIIGKNDTFIQAKTGVQAAFIQNAEIKTEGVCTIEKFCLHSICTCDSFEMPHAQASLVGGHIRASENIHVYNVGNENVGETRLSLYDKKKESTLEKVKELTALKEKISESAAAIKKQVQTKAAIFKKAGDAVTDRQKSELRKWIDELNQFALKIKYVEAKIAEHQRTINDPTQHEGRIAVLGDIYPGTILDFYGMTKLVKSKMTNKKFRVTKESQIEEG